MTYDQAIERFGTQQELARVLGITQPTVSAIQYSVFHDFPPSQKSLRWISIGTFIKRAERAEKAFYGKWLKVSSTRKLRRIPPNLAVLHELSLRRET